MMQSFYTKRLSEKVLSAAALLKLEALPLGITEDLIEKVLLPNTSNDTSYELFVNSGSNGNKTAEIYLLIREKGLQLQTLSETLGASIDSLQHLLTYAGFRVSLMSEEETAVFDDKLRTRSHFMLAVPEEKTRNIASFYAPGGYDAMKELDIPYISSVISESENAGMSIQVNKTVMFPEEKEVIDANLRWLNSFASEESVRGLYAFSKIRSIQNGPVFFVCLTYWGNESCREKIMNNLHVCGYAGLPIPSDVLFERSYLSVGDNLLQSIAITYGHGLNPGIVIPAGCSRLNYLSGIAEITRMLCKAKELKDISGLPLMKSNAGAVSADSIPEKFLSNNGINIGKMVNNDKNIFIPYDSLVKHAVISGMPGSGKTSLVFYILKQLYDKRIPFIAIEPEKTEYRELIDAIPDLKVYTPGKTEVSPFMFNPFLPPENVTLEQYLPRLEEAFKTTISMTTPLDVIFPEVLRNCYAYYGWTNSSTSDSPGVIPFGMHEFICAFKREIQLLNYDPESKQNLQSGGTARFQSLLNANRYLFDTDKSISFDKLLQGYNVIELDAIDKENKAVVLALILMQLRLVISHNQKKDSKLKNVLMLDEAHVILGGSDYTVKKNEADPVGKIRNSYLEMVKVNRAYGTGMIFSDQSLAILADFANNSDVKITMHLESSDERVFLSKNLGYSSDVYDSINSLKLGQFFFSCGEIEKPLLVMAPDTKKNLILSDDIDDEALAGKMKVHHQRPFTNECTCKKDCDIETRNEAEYIARRLYGQITKETLNDKTILENYLNYSLDKLIRQLTEDADNEKKLTKCAKMQLKRMIAEKTEFPIESIKVDKK